MSEDVVIVSAARTAVGAFGGSLSKVPASELGAKVIAALLQRSGLQPDQIDEVIMGQVLTGDVGQNPARQAALSAGIPETTPAMTINKVCGSGLKAVHLALQSIVCGDASVVIAGGQESMSQSPHLLPKSREGKMMGNWELQDSMIVDGLWCALNDYHMGATAENIAEKFGIPREDQELLPPSRKTKRKLRKKKTFSKMRSSPSRFHNGKPIRSYSIPTNFPATARHPKSWPSCGPHSRKTGVSPPATHPGLTTARPL